MRSAHLQKWLEAMQDEIRSISTNNVGDLEDISKRSQDSRLQMDLQSKNMTLKECRKIESATYGERLHANRRNRL
jgi:hypothetical protein